MSPTTPSTSTVLKRAFHRRDYVGLIVWAVIGSYLIVAFGIWPHLTSLDQKIAIIGVAVGFATLILASVTIGLIVRQIQIADRQTELMEVELDITKTQTMILERQVTRKAISGRG